MTAAHPSSSIAPRRALLDWFAAREERLGLDTEEPFRAFAERVFRHRDEFVDLLGVLRAEDARVLGYGASTKGNVVLQFCGLTSADVEATKPEPDLIATAMRRAGNLSAVMVGDSVWDVEAARRAEVKTIAVLTGGFSEAELHDAGAADVFESLVELRQNLDRTPLR